MGVSEGISQFKFYRFQLKGPQGEGELPLGVGLALLALQQVARAPGLELEVRLEGYPGVPALLLVEAQNQRAAVRLVPLAAVGEQGVGKVWVPWSAWSSGRLEAFSSVRLMTPSWIS